jgi:hypothetical protein
MESGWARGYHDQWGHAHSRQQGLIAVSEAEASGLGQGDGRLRSLHRMGCAIDGNWDVV